MPGNDCQSSWKSRARMSERGPYALLLEQFLKGESRAKFRCSTDSFVQLSCGGGVQVRQVTKRHARRLVVQKRKTSLWGTSDGSMHDQVLEGRLRKAARIAKYGLNPGETGVVLKEPLGAGKTAHETGDPLRCRQRADLTVTVHEAIAFELSPVVPLGKLTEREPRLTGLSCPSQAIELHLKVRPIAAL